MISRSEIGREDGEQIYREGGAMCKKQVGQYCFSPQNFNAPRNPRYRWQDSAGGMRSL